jgi:hypothetical protein
MMHKVDAPEILRKNPQVQQNRAREYLVYEKAMRDQGADIKPRYGIVSPLGRMSFRPQRTSSMQKIHTR